MKIEVRYFAEVRELAGVERESLELPSGASTGDLVSLAIRLHPTLLEVENRLLVIVNGEIVNAISFLQEGDAVALAPPLCGG